MIKHQWNSLYSQLKADKDSFKSLKFKLQSEEGLKVKDFLSLSSKQKNN